MKTQKHNKKCIRWIMYKIINIGEWQRTCPYFVSYILVSLFFTKCEFFVFAQFHLKIKGVESSVEFFRTFGFEKKHIIHGLNRKPRGNVFIYLTKELNQNLIGISDTILMFWIMQSTMVWINSVHSTWTP